jgi:hypothetical protein
MLKYWDRYFFPVHVAEVLEAGGSVQQSPELSTWAEDSLNKLIACREHRTCSEVLGSTFKASNRTVPKRQPRSDGLECGNKSFSRYQNG